MGYGQYDLDSHRAATEARAGRPASQVFTQGQCHPDMSPQFLKRRDSRDSPVHPESVSIVFALDVSGSMGEIPHQLATKTLPSFMEAVLTVLPHPQVLFMAFGNAYADRSPLQVGQFESEAHLMDQWLSRIHLEGGGGGAGESYELPMFVAARHTAIDCFEKRGRKGYFFMTGDERTFATVNAAQVKALTGESLPADLPLNAIAEELLNTYHAFFLVPSPDRVADPGCADFWRFFLAERAVVLETPEDTAVVSAILIGITEGALTDKTSIERLLEDRLGRRDEARDRVVRAVLPYLEALAKGPIIAPRPLSPPKSLPPMNG